MLFSTSAIICLWYLVFLLHTPLDWITFNWDIDISMVSTLFPSIQADKISESGFE